MTLRPPSLHHVLALFGIALWLLARPYEGIDRDDVLYLGQVLQGSTLPQLAADPFFAGGSQNDYSLYARLVAPLYAAFGIAATHMALLGVAWLISLGALLRWQAQLGITDRRHALLGLACLAVASPFYGGLRKFGVLEPFLTARTLAEPLLIASLVPLAGGQLRRALLLQVAAATVHPLMALPALLCSWGVAVGLDRRWGWLALAAPGALTLAQLGLAPARLIERYDDTWWQLVATVNPQVLLRQWTGADGQTAATDALLVVLAARQVTTAPARRALLALAGTAALLLGISALGADLWHATLITQLQPWRGLWLLHLAAWVLTPFVLWHTWRRGGAWQLAAASLALAQLGSHAGSLYGLPALAAWALCERLATRGAALAPWATRLGLGLAGSGAVGLAAGDIAARLQRLHWYPTESVALDTCSRIATEPLVALAGLGLVAWAWAAHPRARVAAGAAGLALLALAATHWDRRDALSRAIETPPDPRPFAALLPLQATVYWPEHLAVVWGVLERASHFDAQQGAGLLFHRETAQAFAARQALYQPLIDARDQCRTGVAVSRGSAADLAACDMPRVTHLRSLCRSPDGPDFVVLPGASGVAPLQTWRVGPTAYHLQACAQFSSRERPAAPSAPAVPNSGTGPGATEAADTHTHTDTDAGPHARRSEPTKS